MESDGCLSGVYTMYVKSDGCLSDVMLVACLLGVGSWRVPLVAARGRCVDSVMVVFLWVVGGGNASCETVNCDVESIDSVRYTCSDGCVDRIDCDIKYVVVLVRNLLLFAFCCLSSKKIGLRVGMRVVLTATHLSKCLYFQGGGLVG